MDAEVRLHGSLREIGQAAWDPLVPPDFPFASYAFLDALETSGSVGVNTGWQPLYLTAWRRDRLEAASYLYVKSHSYGEYVFDWEWARAHETHGVPYYPKLLAAVPFTPATGPKFLLLPGAPEPSALRTRLAEGAEAVLGRMNGSSVHYLFLPKEERDELVGRGLLERHGFQFHWRNRGYRDFADFLEALKARKRKSIRKERDEIQEAGLELVTLTGADLTGEHARAMYRFYESTTEKQGGAAYLTPEFFETIFSTLKDNLVMTAARRGDTWIAGALHVHGGGKLFGRHWGASETVRHLHFELCYYRALDFAIAKGITLVEAGAQGEHKVQRGFLPEATYSAHYVANPAFRRAIGDFLLHERTAVDRYLTEWQPELPYRTEADPR